MHRMIRHRKTTAALFGFLAFLVLGAGSCNGSGDTKKSPQSSEAGVRDSSYKSLVAAEPAHTMTNPRTRKTINFWTDTWNVPGQLAFTYIRTGDPAGDGYYVLDGPPVSMCAALTPTYRFVDPGGSTDNPDVTVPAPSIDGVYYSGGQCSSYYGKDASTGSYIEFSIGQGQNYFLSTQPLPKVSGKALGPTDAGMVACSGGTADNVKANRPDCRVR